MPEPGDLVLIPFPFSDLSSTKRRPVLALTSTDANGDFIACPVTSRGDWRDSRRLLPQDLIEGALPLPSGVRFDKVVTLHDSLIVRQFARVSEDIRRTVAGQVCRDIGGAAG